MASLFLAAIADGKTAALADFQKTAAKFHSVVTIPTFETTTNEVAATVARTIANGDTALDNIVRLRPAFAHRADQHQRRCA